MARTSKTVIGGDSGEQSDRMTRAAASGAEAVQRAHSELLNQHRSGADQANQNAQVIGSQVGAGLDRNQQQAQFDRTADQRDDQLDLEGAKAGFERGGGGDRAAQLEAEMAKGEGQPKLGALDPESQQRLNSQVEQGVEMDAHGKWRPTAERTADRERTAKREDFQADTERMRALAYKDQVGVQAQKAYASGDTAMFEEKAKESASYANSSQKLYDRVLKAEIDDEDWPGIAKAARGGVDIDPSLMEAIKKKDGGERVQQFLRAQIQKDAIESIIRTGSDEYLKVDWTLPKLREFQQARNSINDFNRANPALSATAMIKSTADKMRFLNQTAALQVYMGMTQAPSPAAGMTPATQGAPGGAAPGAPGAPRLQHSTVPGRDQGAQAVRDARAGGASPSDALRAGQQAHPTAEQETGMSYERTRRSGL